MQFSFFHIFFFYPFPEIIDGNWGPWSTWTSCSSSCGSGRQIRTRLCDDPAVGNGGENCPMTDSYSETVHSSGVQQQMHSQACNGHSCQGNQQWRSFLPMAQSN